MSSLSTFARVVAGVSRYLCDGAACCAPHSPILPILRLALVFISDARRSASVTVPYWSALVTAPWWRPSVLEPKGKGERFKTEGFFGVSQTQVNTRARPGGGCTSCDSGTDVYLY